MSHQNTYIRAKANQPIRNSIEPLTVNASKIVSKKTLENLTYLIHNNLYKPKSPNRINKHNQL